MGGSFHLGTIYLRHAPPGSRAEPSHPTHSPKAPPSVASGWASVALSSSHAVSIVCSRLLDAEPRAGWGPPSTLFSWAMDDRQKRLAVFAPVQSVGGGVVLERRCLLDLGVKVNKVPANNAIIQYYTILIILSYNHLYKIYYIKYI